MFIGQCQFFNRVHREAGYLTDKFFKTANRPYISQSVSVGSWLYQFCCPDDRNEEKVCKNLERNRKNSADWFVDRGT